MIKVGMCFSQPLQGNQPLDYVGKKLLVYLRFLQLCQQKGWQVYVLTKKTYNGDGLFKGSWLYQNNEFVLSKKPVKMDLVYDRTAGLDFPPENTGGMIIVDRRDFKVMSCDKYQTYLEIGQYMPPTYWVGKKENLKLTLEKIKTKWVVLKPFNALKGIGIYIGPKNKALNFQFSDKYPLYIAQEFIDTSGGILGIVNGKHDLRIVVVNGEVVWCHVRTPPKGEFLANVARGGSITEIDYERQAPESIKKIVADIAPQFYKKYNNPVYCFDFGMSKKGPKIFEINDTMGFPLWGMKNRDKFLKALVKNFEEKLARKNGKEK